MSLLVTGEQTPGGRSYRLRAQRLRRRVDGRVVLAAKGIVSSCLLQVGGVRPTGCRGGGS